MAGQATFGYADQTVVVTGASSGIGATLANKFAEAGAIVVSQGFSKMPVTQVGGFSIQLDMHTYDAADQLAAAAKQRTGRIDVWINNAGTYPIGSVTDLNPADEVSVLDANIGFVMRGTRAAAQHAAESGLAIINIASIEGFTPALDHSHYGAAKAAVLAHTKAAAAELGDRHIRVNAIAPGLIDRPGLLEAWPEGVERWLTAAPLQRVGTGDDIANAALFLGSAQASWITGTTLVVDGGVLARSPW